MKIRLVDETPYTRRPNMLLHLLPENYGDQLIVEEIKKKLEELSGHANPRDPRSCVWNEMSKSEWNEDVGLCLVIPKKIEGKK